MEVGRRVALFVGVHRQVKRRALQRDEMRAKMMRWDEMRGRRDIVIFSLGYNISLKTVIK